MSDELRINLKIADRSYPMNIKKEQEESYRRAADEINRLIRFFEENYKVSDRQDSLAMCAISFALKITQNTMNQDNTNIETQEKLEIIHQMVDELLQR